MESQRKDPQIRDPFSISTPQDEVPVADPSVELDDLAKWRQELAENKRKASIFLEGDGVTKMYMALKVLHPQIHLIRSLLFTNEPAWDLDQMKRTLDGERRTYRLLELDKRLSERWEDRGHPDTHS